MRRATRGIGRRAFLRGAGVCLALPWLESWGPREARAQGRGQRARRLVAFFAPNGLQPDRWWPSTTGADFELSPVLQPFTALRRQLLLVRGLENAAAADGEDGDHLRGTGTFLTCTRLPKGDVPLANGPSLEQVAVRALAPNTRFPSLQLGLEQKGGTGLCDADYACAYDRHISWNDANTPLPKMIDPRLVFERLFAGADQRMSAIELGRRRAQKQSVLDVVREQAQALAQKTSQRDRRKIDEYLTGLRELELLVQSEGVAGQCAVGLPEANAGRDLGKTMKAMNELMAAALTCDLTRFITFMIGDSTSTRGHAFLGAPESHHELSHHGGDPATLAKLDAIVTWELTQFAELATRLSHVEEEDGSVLDHTILLLSSDVVDGDRHDHHDLPVILVGGSAGALATGQHAHFGGREPLANLYLTILEALGVQAPQFGDDGTRVLAALRGPA